MLGKLMKQEFRATGRLMLPTFGALLLLSVLANISIRLLDREMVNNGFLRVLAIFVIFAFGLGIFGVLLMTLVLMVTRFYRNLLKDEGYLMHTLPVTVHGLVWSKLFVSLIWFVVSGLIIGLIVSLTVLIQNGTDLGELLRQLPGLWAKLRELMEAQGVAVGRLGTLGVLGLVLLVMTYFASSLHFYAAMAMGHMFNRDKILLSVVFYVAISFVLSFLMNTVGHFSSDYLFADEFSFRMLRNVLLGALGYEAVQAALLYFATTLSLRRGLNLS